MPTPETIRPDSVAAGNDRNTARDGLNYKKTVAALLDLVPSDTDPVVINIMLINGLTLRTRILDMSYALDTHMRPPYSDTYGVAFDTIFGELVTEFEAYLQCPIGDTNTAEKAFARCEELLAGLEKMCNHAVESSKAESVPVSIETYNAERGKTLSLIIRASPLRETLLANKRKFIEETLDLEFAEAIFAEYERAQIAFANDIERAASLLRPPAGSAAPDAILGDQGLAADQKYLNPYIILKAANIQFAKDLKLLELVYASTIPSADSTDPA